MLFNSYVFIFLFLPVVLAGFYGLRRGRVAWLVFASLVYYGYWKPVFLLLLGVSILGNYAAVAALMRRQGSKPILTLGVGFNLALLGYFKYAGFLVENLNAVAGAHLAVPHILLPIGISFFTFQQIALVADAYRGDVRNFSLLNHAFFVTFFPQLIAGPIVHHAEIMPQLDTPAGRPARDDLAVGTCIFVVGLFKKVIVADGLAMFADAGFDTIHAGFPLGPASAWIAIFAYAFQIYFDFSGYSDMAVGLARMFGLLLPVNFFSPYKACGFIDFWRRWHITLSRFLKDYLYIPLGGNRRGRVRQYLNLAAVMLLGGLWHGAAWKFVLWGGGHGVMLIANHLWNRLPVARLALWRSRLVRIPAIAVTFVAAALLWVPFRADTLGDAIGIFRAACPAESGVLWPSISHFLDKQFGHILSPSVLHHWFTARELWPTPLPPDYLSTVVQPVGLVLAAVAVLTFALPNTTQLFARFDPAAGAEKLAVRLSLRVLGFRWAVATAAMFVIAVFGLSHLSPFLYFQF